MQIQKILWSINLFLRRPFFKKIGVLSYMGPTVSLLGTGRISIGNRVRIYPGARMETHDSGEIIIEDECSIAQNFHVTSGKNKLIIGEKTTISGNVFITNIDHEYRNIDEHIMNQPMIYKETIIGKNCFIGFGASIQAGTVLGNHCIVGTNAVVRGIFPDYSVIVGVPARVVKHYDEVSGEWIKN